MKINNNLWEISCKTLISYKNIKNVCLVFDHSLLMHDTDSHIFPRMGGNYIYTIYRIV